MDLFEGRWPPLTQTGERRGEPAVQMCLAQVPGGMLHLDRAQSAAEKEQEERAMKLFHLPRKIKNRIGIKGNLESKPGASSSSLMSFLS